MKRRANKPCRIQRSDSARRGRKTVFREGPKNVCDFEKYIDADCDGDYFVKVEPAGKGFHHVLTEDEIETILSRFPDSYLANLHTVYLPTMTRKRQRMDIYGLQWGGTIYLYPMPDNLLEEKNLTLGPKTKIEVAKYGGRIITDGACDSIQWDAESIHRFYAENILVHELGHIVDQRNTKEVDRERFAEEFAERWGRRGPKRKPTPRRKLDEQEIQKGGEVSGG